MNVIILGDNHNNTLSLLRSLGEEGHYIVLLLHKLKHNYANRSKYVKTCRLIEEGDDIIQIIKDITKGLNDKPALFTCDDYDASFIEDHRKELCEFCYCEGGCGDENINCYRNKDVSNNLAAELGFVIPKNVVLEREDEALIKDLQYPVMLKANNSIHGGKEVQEICDDSQTLSAALKKLPSDSYPVQVQEYIEKEYEIMLQGCSCNGGKDVYCEVANRRIRVYPFIYGACSYGKGVEIEKDNQLRDLRDRVKEYLGKIEYNGQFSAEFLYCKGLYYFLEVNLRNDGTAYLSTKCGCNLPDLYCRCINDNESSCIEKSFNPSFYMNALGDVHYVLARKLSIFKWISQLIKSNCYSHFNLEDPIPYLYYILSVLLR